MLWDFLSASRREQTLEKAMSQGPLLSSEKEARRHPAVALEGEAVRTHTHTYTLCSCRVITPLEGTELSPYLGVVCYLLTPSHS